MQKNSGYTLIEVMTVIGIIAIVCGIVVPNVLGWLPKYRLRSGAEEIQSALQLARLDAVKRNTETIVTFDTANHTYLTSISGQTIKSGNMPSGITIDDVTNPSSQVKFNGRGLASTSTSILVKNIQGETKTITVNIVGIAAIQ